MLKIEIKTGNAAFCDPFTGEPSEFDEAIECKRLLEGICRELEDGATSGNIIDINGNKVGQWSRQERVYMAKHIIDKDNTLKALGSINTLLSQSLQIIKKVNEDEQWDFCTDDVLARRVNDAERLIKEISDVVFQN